MSISTSDLGDPTARRITVILTRFLAWVSAHWLALANSAIGLYAGLPLLAPILMHWGLAGPAHLIYTVFKPLCHQLPERSFFLFGERMIYSYEELSTRLGGLVPARYIGSPEIGYKAAICERDVAIYTSMVLFGIAFGWARDRIKPLTIKQFALFVVPMAVDGFGQLFGLWTSTWLSRVITGALFGLGCVLLAYPYLHQGMTQIRQEASSVLRGDTR